MLHAGWPGGMILGGVIAYLFCGSKPLITHIPWEVAIGLFLIPTLIYGVIVLKEKFPISEARAAGVSFVTMLLEFAFSDLVDAARCCTAWSATSSWGPTVGSRTS